MSETCIEVKSNFRTYFKQNKKVIGIIISLLVGFVLWLIPPFNGLTPEGQKILASIISLITLLIFEVISIGLTCLLWACFITMTGLVKGSVAFSGFINDTTWLILGAFMIGVAATKTNVARRIAYNILKYCRNSYYVLTLMIVIVGWVLSLFIPSGTSRSAILLPVFIGTMEVLKIRENSNLGANFIILFLYAMGIGGPSITIYTATLMNPIIGGALKSVVNVDMTWGLWVWYNIIPGIFTSIILWGAIHLIAKPETKSIEGGVEAINKELVALGKLTNEEKKAAFWMLLALVLWATESVHHISAAYVALFIGTMLFLPKVGVLKNKDLSSLPWDTFLFIGAALAIGNALKAGKVDAWITKFFMDPFLEPMANLGIYGVVIGLFIFVYLVHLFIPSSTACLTAIAPLTISWAVNQGVNPIFAGIITGMGAHPFIFPYQIMPIMITWPYAKVTVGKVAYVALGMSIVYFICTIISAFIWWIPVIL